MIEKNMKILVITKSAWDNTNSIGNTLSNLFSGIDYDQLANLYFRSVMPKNNVCKNYFSISDKEVIKSIFNNKRDIGTHLMLNKSSIETILSNSKKTDEGLYDNFRIKNSRMLLLIQEFIWGFLNLNNRKLNKFLNDFKPNIIFAPCFSKKYLHTILWKIRDITQAKVILFHADDHLTPNENLTSIIQKIYSRNRAKFVINSINMANLNYGISNIQCEEYEEKTGVHFNLLCKGGDFRYKPQYTINDSKIKIVFIGSILYGRWKTLAILANCIKNINFDECLFELDIYSQYVPNEEMLKTINIEKVSTFKGKLEADEIMKTYSKYDIVLHVESFDIKERNKTRLSFSTKIVDCLQTNRAILAIGWEKAASINYFIEENAGLVASSKKEIYDILIKIKNNRAILAQYAKNAWDCGVRNHVHDKIQKELFGTFRKIIYTDNSKSENSK